MYPLDDFVSEHDPLYVRVLLMECNGQRQAIVLVDMTSLTQPVIVRMKTVLSGVAAVAADNIIVNASHSFSTPHIISQTTKTQTVLAAFETVLHSAALLAVNNLQPARLGSGSGYGRVGVNRNINTPYGWWLGADDKGYTDPHIGVIALGGEDGKLLAVLLNYAVQPAVMDASQKEAGGRLVSADLAGAVARYVERHYDDLTVAFYLVGCAGDQVPYLQASRHVVHADGSVGRTDTHEKGFALLALFGQRLGDEVTKVLDRITWKPANIFRLSRHDILLGAQKFSPRNPVTGPVSACHYQLNGVTPLPVVFIQRGDIVLVGVQPELSAITGAQIRAASPFVQTFVMTMVDGAAKYLPDVTSYQRLTYEACSSPYAPGAAEVAAQAIINQLKEMWTMPASE
ncbi:hypothetical protein [Erwinia psidii]|uniref:Neutral/alkaline non-lysosomal ceramidase N-terminal domain-containing protein n=1 Tax=Erwinia psidii TaxID=69224 RepID=A0A3N6S134_9GAMM|nr:hypothetical protein [Erwinia psidii]MCX8960955.1 hypothetical protein [Erwinia psidii]RQM38517.1 hypothetical protein EB241_09885 [Erwinia psidii]